MALSEEKKRAGAIAFINKETGQNFEDGKLPADIEIAVDIIMGGMNQNPAIASQSLGDMSKSFFDNSAIEKAARKYYKSYIKAKFI